MFKIFMTENNTTVIPNILNTYTNPRVNDNFGNNVLFQYYNTGVEVYTKRKDDNSFALCLFEINKNINFMRVGTTSFNKGDVQIDGETIELFALNCFRMYLNGSANHLIDFSFIEDEIIFQNKSNLKDVTKDAEIIILFGIDLTDLEKRLTIIENAEISIGDIHSNNPYVGLDPLHIVSVNQTNIPGNNDDTTFFKYYKVLNTDLTTIAHFGVVMFLVDKGLGVTEIDNTVTGSVNFIGDLYLTNDTDTA
jgi:hypothetical protein